MQETSSDILLLVYIGNS